jgi:hypothetical protein
LTAVLFLGPSLPSLHRRPPPRIDLRPPAAQGDLMRAVAAGARLVGLVDGVFGHEPAVWHKEILAALEAGVRVLGAASMGALRAAELHRFGMEGVGTVFAAYRDGLLEADDEVALLHGPAELGWPALSEPMVNLRATLARLARLGIVGQGEAARVARVLAARFYPERSRAALEAALRAEVGPARAETVVRWARRSAVDAKAADAARLVRRLRALLAAPPRPLVPRFALSRTAPFRRLERTLRAPVHAAPEPVRVAGELPATPRPERPWSLIGLIAADNDLAPEVRADLDELLAAPTLDRLHVAGELDTSDGALCGRFALADARPDRGAHLALARRGPRNTGDPALLRDLLRWALAVFPARRRALLFWGHGQGARIAIDDGAGDALTIVELVGALADGLADRPPLDLVLFDACLMAKLELLADLAPFARLVLASGEVVPASGLPYHRAAAILATSETAEAAAGALVEAFLDDAAARGQAHARLLAARTEPAAAAMAALGQVGDRLAALLPDARAAILEARLLARSARAGQLVDLIDLLRRLDRRLDDPELGPLLAAATLAAGRCVLRSAALWPSRGPIAGGINIWFPSQAGLLRSGRDEYAARPAIRGAGAGWLRFLDRLHGVEVRDKDHSAARPDALDTLLPP